MSAWALEPEAQAAKDESIHLYNIQHSRAALPYLEQAAAGLPQLVQDRPADPTTREHDSEAGRDPRFWRDMDDATYERYVEAQQGKINALYL